MSGRPSLSWLDLRLMLSRQPGASLLLAGVIVAIFWLFTHPPEPAVPAASPGVDPARLAAARHSFRNILIAPAALASSQQALLETAATHQLAVGQVDYAQESNAAGFVQASMRLPLTGRYADIRAFLSSALAAEPALAIRHLSLQRDAGDNSTTVTASLTLQFLVGESGR